MDKKVSLYYDCYGSQIAYGYTIWDVTGTENSYKNDHGNGSSFGVEYTNVSFDLMTVDKGTKPLSDLGCLIESLIMDFSKDSDSLIMADSPSNRAITNHIRESLVHFVDPLSGNEERLRTYGSLMNDDRYHLGDFLQLPDLIFDDLGGNLIDPVSSDLESSFPITQALLLALGHFKDLYQSRMFGFSSVSTRPRSDYFSDLGLDFRGY